MEIYTFYTNNILWSHLLITQTLYIYIYAHTYIHTCMHAYTQTYIHAYIHTYIFTHTNIHTYIHTHIHTYTHTYMGAGRAQSVSRLATGWTFRGTNPGGGQIIPTRPDRL